MIRTLYRPSGATAPAARTAFLDNLKVFLTVLVVMHHAGQPYGPTGGAWPVMHAEKFRLLGPFFHINASFFMGLFFLVSGYFLPAAYERRGAAGFLRERLRRLGIPVLLFGAAFMPLARHLVGGKPWADCFWPFEWAHLWFLGHLLVYSAAYVLYRACFPRAAADADATTPFPGPGRLLGYALLLALASTVLRIWYPIDLWVRIAGVPAELAHLPQYLSLFVFGILAASHRWLERIPPASGRAWLLAGAGLVTWRFGYTLFHGQYLGGDGLLFDYAWNQWEALLCVALCVGLPYAFRAHVAGAGAGARFLARHAFLVYILHLPVLVFIQMALEKTALGPLTLTLLSGTLTLLLCYGWSGVIDAVRKWKSRPPLPRAGEGWGAGGREGTAV